MHNASARSPLCLPGHGALPRARWIALTLLLALLPGTVLAQGYRNPLVNAATVAAPADIADPTPGNNTSSDSNALAASAQLSVLKTITSPTPVAAGGAVQYRIEIRNLGPSQAIGATLVDTVPAQLTAVGWTCATVSANTQCAVAAGAGSINVAVNVGVGEVLVVLVNGTAPTTTPATIAANVATLTPPPGTSDPTPGDNTATTPTIPVQAAPLVANDDDFRAVPLPPGAGGTTASVLGNDTLNGVPVVAGDMVLSLTTAPSGYTIAANGTISVPATAASGPVTLTYQLCEQASPANCDNANVQLVVGPNAVDDSYAVQAGAQLAGNVRDNDNYVVDSTFTQTGTAPTQGTLQLLSDGNFTYTANPGATGTDTFSYQLCLTAPNNAVCDTATVTLNINASIIDAVADDFTATPVPAQTGGALVTSVLANDTFDGNPVVPANLTTTLITAPTGYVMSAGGIITVPAGASAGPVTLAYRICVTSAPTLCDTANVLLVVGPDAVDDAVTTPGAGQPVLGNVGSNDIAAPGAQFTLTTPATQGTAVIGADGAFTYTPNPGATGTDSFSYQVCLPAPYAGVCDTATVTVTIGANAVLANDDAFPTPIAYGVGGSTPTVLGNDTLNGTPVVQGTVSATLQGAVAGFSLDATTGIITVAANAAAGATTLTYTLCEVAAPLNCDDANVQVLVSPGAVADSFTVQAGQSVTGSIATNDNAPVGAQYSAITQPAQGTIDLAGNGGLTYTANPATSGTDSFNYQVCLPAPNGSICSIATVTLTIAANTVDAINDTFTVPVISPVTGGSTASVLGNDTFNAAPVTATQVTLSLANTPPPGYTITAAGVINVPAGAAAGAVTLSYQLCEAGSTTNCDIAQVALVIAPVAVTDTFSTPAGQNLVGDVGLNDNAPAGATFSVVTPPAAGTFTLQTDGSFTYTPAGAGAQTVQYQVCLPAPDNATCATGTVNVTVVANTLDAVNDDFRSAVFTPGAGGTTPTVFGNDTFNGAPVTPLQVTVNLVAAPGGFSIDGNGVITVSGFAPAGATTLNYSLCELGSTTNCDTAAVQVLVSPDAVDDAVATTIGQTLAGNVAGNDNAPAGAAYTLSSPATSGTATVNADGTFSYVPAGTVPGSASFAYQVCLPAPDAAVCDTATVTVTIGANALDAVDDNLRVPVFAPGAGGTTATVLGNDSFNGAPIVAGQVSVSLLTPPLGYSVDATGIITVAPTATAGAVTLNYQICDALDGAVCDSAAVLLLVSPNAVDDSVSATGTQPVTTDLASNDNAPAGSTFTLTVAPTKGTAVLNAAGSLDYTPTAGQTGADTLTYQVCLPAPDGAVCDTAQVAITIASSAIAAVSDDFSAAPVAPTGGSTASVLLNDTFGGAPIVPGTTPVTASLTTPVAGYTMAADGVVSVAAGTTPAATTLNYQVCETALPTNCASATALVAVSPAAVDDTLPATAGATTVLAVTANDTLPVNPTITVPVAPTNGTAVVNPDNTISYTPTAGYTGADSFTYQVCLPAPNGSVCDTATVTLTVAATSVTAVNDDFSGAPIAPTGGTTASVLLNDTFNGAPIVPGTTPVTASLVTPVAGYSMAADGVVTVAPGTLPAATTLSYQVCETALPTNCAQATALVAVRPDAANDTLPAGTGTTVLNVGANDTLPLNPVFTVSVVPANGTAVVNGDNTISYTPTAGFTGADSFTYQVCLPAPNLGVCDTATVSLTVAATAIVANDDNFSATPTTPGAGGVTASVLGNDTFSGAPVVPAQVVVSLQSPPSGVSIDSNGLISIAGSAAAGAVPVGYQICETGNALNCDSASALVVISPDAVDDTFTTASGQAVNDNLGSNDNVATGSVLSLVTAPAQGTVVLNANGSFVYTPLAGFAGNDSFIYRACLPAPYAAVCDTATASFTVGAGVVDAVDDTASNVPATGALGLLNVFANDTFNGAALDPATVLLTPSNTTALTIQPNGSLDVAAGTPGVTYTTTYRICLVAQPAVCDIGTVSVTLASTPGLLDAVDDTVANVPAAGATGVANVLANDTYNNAALDPATVVLTPVNTSALTIRPDGSVDVAAGTPGTTYTTTYQICLVAQPAVCDVGTVSVTLASAGALVAADDTITSTPPGGATGVGNVLANDTFNGAPLDPATVVLTPVNTPTLTIQPNGSVDVAAGTPGTTYTTTYQICLVAQPTVCDVGTLSVTLAAAPNAVPVASDDQASTPQETAVEIPVLANDLANGVPIDPGTVTVTITTPPTSGTAVVLPDGRVRYTPAPDYSGADSFAYTVCSQASPSTCSTATVNVQTQPNDVDVVDENITVLSGTTTRVALLDNLTTTGARINAASMRLGRAASSGRAACADGECVYTAFVGYSGLDNFSYNICDSSTPTPVCVEGWVNVVVTADAVVLRLTKQATQRSVQVGDVVRYVVTVENMGDIDALGVTLLDTLPSGFTFIPGGFEVRDADNAARASGVAPLRIDGLDVPAGGSATLVYYLRVGAGVGLGVHTNRITAADVLGTTISNVAAADVEVIGDPLLDESLVIGSVFDDRNGNGMQDDGERGIPGVRVVSVEGLVIETDAYGRYHLVGINGGQARGRNFILKVDPSTLPAEARFTTRNPLLRRITPGLPVRFDFGVALPEGRIGAGPPLQVLEVGEALFVPGQATLVATAEPVLAHAARTLDAQGGGQINVAVGQATPALAAQRAEVLRDAVLPRLPAAVAARVQVQVQPAAPARPADRADR